MVKFLHIAIFAGLALSGCSPINKGKPIRTIMDATGLGLTPMAAEAVKAQKRLAQIRFSQTPVRNDRVIIAPPELNRHINRLEWTGPVEVLASNLAQQAGYSFITVGRPPKTGITVHVSWTNISIIDALSDVGVRIGRQAILHIDTDIGRIEVRYE